jgi:DeoR/GlpR family transcriptional regulator of sugar metabolism
MYVAQERRAYILRILQQRGSIRSATIARELGVTDETIRTDLVDMQAQGLLKRTHGGARYILPTPGSDSSARPDCQLAALAAAHIKPGMCIYLDNDPLALVLVSQLGDIPCTLVSNSPELLARLSTSPMPQQIICTGGMPCRTGQSPFFRPSSVAIHNNSNMHRDIISIYLTGIFFFSLLIPKHAVPSCL